MRLSTAVAATAWLTSFAQASSERPELSVNIARNVTAETATTITFTSDEIDLSNLRDTVSILLYNSVSNWPVCSLSKTALSAGSTTVEIPASVGPSGFYYRLAMIPGESTDAYNLSGSWPFSTPIYTDLFFLSGGASAWSSAEAPDRENAVGLDHFFGAWSFDAAGTLPCAAYDCGRRCAYKQLPYSEAWSEGQAWRTCLEACPDVSLIPRSLSSIAAVTDGVPSPTTASVLPTPSGCSSVNFHSPCGTKCCSPNEYCEVWAACINVIKESETSSHISSGLTRTTSATTGGGSVNTPSSSTVATSTSTAGAPPGLTAFAHPVPAVAAMLWVFLDN